ncbi:phosphoribosylglycinamide formyltransferase [Stieleria sp. TO1_6]|uniref:phosphoribosylglycinamide formyltransferase n=1 Tax=Stieleria tagensis TaxID=2956795 RepID=UPI00209B1AAB|nr:phosphoribosylglycinamide formyltransferase [Stieleria tagensis]MCO8125433.1 phosphoribosylglycinamide formyltransferase [Stieleria tagensis]
MSSAPTKLPIAVFLSGGGRTLENLLRHRDEHDLPIDVRLVISSRPGVRGLDIASQHGIESLVIRKSDFDDPDYREAMFEPVREFGTRYVVMAGFLKHVLIPDDFHNRVINIHPSLLPAFGGKGMYGHNVHAAAIARGVTISGCTVHFVDNQYDHGPIILQQSCEVRRDDTPDTLAARVFEKECEALPAALRTLL